MQLTDTNCPFGLVALSKFIKCILIIQNDADLLLLSWFLKVSGGYSDGDTPDPIPNSEVKPIRADGTWTAGSRKSRSLPD